MSRVIHTVRDIRKALVGCAVVGWVGYLVYYFIKWSIVIA